MNTKNSMILKNLMESEPRHLTEFVKKYAPDASLEKLIGKEVFLRDQHIPVFAHFLF